MAKKNNDIDITTDLKQDEQEPQATASVLKPAIVEEVPKISITYLPVLQEDETLPSGHVLLAELDGNGQETGSTFTVHERGYKKLYNDPTKFALKKKAQ